MAERRPKASNVMDKRSTQFNQISLTQRSTNSGALSLIDQVAVSATGFFSGVIVARGCTLSELGVYHLAISVLLILRGIQADLITSPFAVYNCRRDNAGIETYTGSIFVHQLILTICAVILLILLYFLLSKGYATSGLLKAMPALICVAPMVLLREFFRLYSYARLEIKYALITDCLVMVIQLIGLFWIAMTLEMAASQAILTIGCACGLACISWWFVVKPRFQMIPSRIKSDWHLNWMFGRWALASFIVCNCTPYMMTWIVSWLRSDAETGKFGACLLLVGLSNLIIIAINNVLTPISAETHLREGFKGLLHVGQTVVIGFALVLGGFSVVMFFTGDWVGGLIYGSNFDDVGYLCGILALAKLIEGVSLVAVKMLWALDRPRSNLPADFITLLVTLLSALCLLPEYGIISAAMSILAGNVAGAGTRWLTIFSLRKKSPA